MTNTINTIIDTHAHLYLDQFDEDRPDVMQRAAEVGVIKVLLPNIDISTIGAMHQMEIDFPNVCHAMMGLHPCSVKPDYNNVLDVMEKNIELRPYIGIGETGVDLYWDKTFRPEQIESFKRQLQWGRELDLPVVIHSRESLDLNISIVEEMQDGRLKAVFHCFNGTVEQAKEIAGLGCYLGLGGVITFKNGGMKEILKELPLEYVMLETDAPYLTPTPHRGKRNESAYVKLVAETLAEEVGMSFEQVANLTTKNALILFSALVD